MNSQISFSNEEKKEVLSTPKFHKNKSIFSIERDENTLDTLKQNINSIINIEKLNNDKNSNNIEDANGEFKNENINKNVFVNSLLNRINSKNEMSNCFSNQFSFDEKSENYIFSNNEKENNKENINNNIIIIDNNENENKENDNNEIKYIDTINSNIKDNNDYMENNFNYILPLESDKSSEHFKFISFQGCSEENQEKKIKIPNQKKMAGERKIYNNPEIVNKKIGIGVLSKQKENPEKIIIKDDIKLTPHKKNKNSKVDKYKIINSEKSNHKIKKINNSNKNSSKNKRNFNIKIPSLIDDNKQHDKCYTEPNNLLMDSKNSQINTFFTSNEHNSNITPKKENKINNSIRPFIIEKTNSNKNDIIIKKNVIKENIIKEIALVHFNKKNFKIRNSINFHRKNKFNESNKNRLIYEKNFIGKENRSFSINKKEKNSLIHSRNYSQLSNKNNTNFTYDHSRIKKKIKNCVFLLSQKNLKNSAFETRNNSYGNSSISASDNSTQKTIKIIKEKKEIGSPFYKSRILNKNSLSTKFILNNQSSSLEDRKIKINININNEKFENNNTFISSNKFKNNNKFTVFCNYDSKKNKNNTSKEKINNTSTNKIKVNIANNNNNSNNKFYQKNTSFMNYKINKPHLLIEDSKGSITERYRDSLTERYRDSIVGPANIYTKKLIFNNSSNSNTNIYTKLNNEKNNSCRIKKNIERKSLNKSSIIQKEIKIPKIEFNSNNNSIIIKDKNKFREYFNDILSNINLSKNIKTKKQKINNYKKIKPKNRNNIINSNISNISSIYTQTEKDKEKEKEILSTSKINSFKPKIKYKKKDSKNSEKINKQFNTINNSINFGCNNKFRENPKISKKKTKIAFSRENSLNIPNFRKNIVKYSIIRNNQTNQIRSEVSIYIGKQNINNEKNNLEKNNNEFIKKKKGKFSIDNNKLKAINVNKKTIINVNQFYPSYFINNNSNIFKNKNNMSSFLKNN